MPDTVNLRDETTGQTFGVPADKVAAYKAQGFREESPQERIDRQVAETFHEEHGGVGGAIVGGVAGGLSGLTLGGSDLALGALGAGRTLSHIEAEHPYASGGGTLAGALLPTVLTGGAAAGGEAAGLGARILARTPAGLAGRLGGAVGGLGEGAGLVGRTVAGAAGAAAEGSLYGGGQYLTETALEDKPLSAEGFVAGMGHGALFAAPIGAAGHLASATLQRARSLFPRSEVSAAAAAGVKEQASSALAQTMRDGDAMIQAAERKLSDIDAGVGMAQAGETVTRRVFGEAHPQALADQVTGATARQEVAQALEGYQQARTQFEDWMAHEADPELEKALAGLTSGELQTPALAAPRVPVGEFGAPGARGVKTPEELQRALEDSAPEAAAAAPAADQPATAVLRGAEGTPPGGVPAQEIVQRGMADEGTAIAVGRRPAAASTTGRIEVRDVGRQHMQAIMPDGSVRDLGRNGAGKFLDEQMPPGFHAAKIETHLPFVVEHGLPATAADVARLDENAIYIAKPSQLAERDLWGNELREENRDSILKAWRDGKTLRPVDGYVMPDGRLYIEDGNHRIQAAARDGDRPVAIRFKNGEGYRPQSGAHEIGERIREDLPTGNGSSAAPEGFDIRAHAEGGRIFSDNPKVHTGIPKFSDLSRETFRDNAFIVRPSELEGPKLRGITSGEDMVADTRTAKVRDAWKNGERVPALEIDVDPKGNYFIADGNHRLLAAAAEGDRPMLVRFRPVEAEVGNMDRIGDDLARALGRKPAAGEDLLAALSGTKAAVDKGENLVEMGAPARDAYRAAKAERTSAAAEHFRGKALEAREARAEAVAAGETPNPFHEPTVAAHGGDLDQFFADLRAPKTRDAYVAQNIGRAMREEGSHAAALAKVEREWAERSATEAWAERAAVLEYEGGYSRAEAERIARDEMGNAARGPAAEPPPVWESKKNPKRMEAAKKAAAASVERLHEIHSAVASNLPQELQTAWNEEGYKFLRDESARIRGVKDRINAASKISEAFTEKYGAASETGRGYEGDRFHRRAEIEARHAESWANEQERKYYASAARGEHPLDVKRLEMAHDTAVERAATAADPAERAAAAQEAKVIERELTAVGRAPTLESRAAAEPEVGDATMGRILAKHGLGEPSPAGAAAPAAEPDALGARILRNESRPAEISPTAPVSAAAVAGEGKLAGPMSKAEIAEQRARFRAIAPEQRAAKAIMRHHGKGVDIGPRIAREAKVIGDMEQASARLADALGPEAPPTAVTNAKAFHEATAKAQDRAAASSAKLGADLQNKVPAMTGGTDATAVDDDVVRALRKHESRMAARGDKTTVSPAPEMPAANPTAPPPAGASAPAIGLGSKAADVGSALEVMRAIGMHVPAISHIPVIGPILGLWLKARAVMGIIGRKGGSIGKSTEGLIASKAAAVQDRIVAATGALLETGGRAAGKASHLAGAAALLGGSLFPGGEKPASDKPRDLFEARSDDITRAMQPGAIDQAISQRYPTSDPAMHDAIVAQVQRGIAFLDSKRPKQTVLPGVLPGDGTWKPSMAAIEEFGKYVHAVNDPVSVLEDLAKGHPSAEGAETLRAVYPELYRYAQKELLAAAPEMARTLPYPRRVMLSILYQIPVDGTMQPSHAQFLQTPAPAPAAASPPPSTGPLRLGQQTLSPLDQRAGA